MVVFDFVSSNRGKISWLATGVLLLAQGVALAEPPEEAHTGESAEPLSSPSDPTVTPDGDWQPEDTRANDVTKTQKAAVLWVMGGSLLLGLGLGLSETSLVEPAVSIPLMVVGAGMAGFGFYQGIRVEFFSARSAETVGTPLVGFSAAFSF